MAQIGFHPMAEAKRAVYLYRTSSLNVINAAVQRSISTNIAMTTPLKRFLLVILSLGFITLASVGCQTKKGFGRDVERAGEKIQGH
jgi:predicted small secreted protein